MCSREHVKQVLLVLLGLVVEVHIVHALGHTEVSKHIICGLSELGLVLGAGLEVSASQVGLDPAEPIEARHVVLLASIKEV